MSSEKLSALPFKEKAPGYKFYGTDDTPARGKFDMVPALNAQTGTSYTLALTDSYDIVTMSNASANTLTIPANAAVAFPVGTIIDIVQGDTGATTIQGDTGVTLNGTSAGSVVITAQFGVYRLVKIATNEWIAERPVQTESLMIDVGDETTALTTGTAKKTFRMPYAFRLSAVRGAVATAPTGADLVVDINEGGASILSTKLSIDAGEKTSTTAATPPVISDSDLADDAEMTIDIDQIGSTVAGAGLKVTLIGTRL